MTQPPGHDPVPTLQTLNFQPAPGPEHLAVYQARVKYQTAPDAPEYIVTATTASPDSDAERAALEDLLSKIRAVFSLLTQPIPVDSGDIPVDSGDVAPGSFDPGTQIKFEVGIEFARPGPGPVGLAATIEAATGPSPMLYRDTVDPYKKDHVWQSRGGAQQATVHVDQGRGTIRATRPPSQTVVAGGGREGRYYAFGTQITMHGDVRMVYDLDGNFTPP